MHKKMTGNRQSYLIEEVHSYNLNIISREIFIHGDLGFEDDNAVDFHMANRFIKNIRILENENKKPIIIHQHSEGGDWPSGMMIYDAIHNSTCPTVFIMWGLAASMGSIIPQSASLRICSPYTWMLIHDGYTGIDNILTHKKAQSWSKWENVIRNQMIDIYTSVCQSGPLFEGLDEAQTRRKIVKLFDQKDDVWISSEQMIEYGFADGILGEEGYENIEAIVKELE